MNICRGLICSSFLLYIGGRDETYFLIRFEDGHYIDSGNGIAVTDYSKVSRLDMETLIKERNEMNTAAGIEFALAVCSP